MSDTPSAVPIVELGSPFDHERTVERIIGAIKSAGLIVLAQLDHARGAKSVGLAMPPTLVIVYGHPNGGTPVMLAHPGAALDLPLRVLVRSEAGGRTLVSYHPVAAMLAASGVPTDMARRLEPAQALIARALQA